MTFIILESKNLTEESLAEFDRAAGILAKIFDGGMEVLKDSKPELADTILQDFTQGKSQVLVHVLLQTGGSPGAQFYTLEDGKLKLLVDFSVNSKATIN